VGVLTPSMRKRYRHGLIDGSLLDNARHLRANATEAETMLWNRLRRANLNGLRFRRQVPIAGFIADFCCRENKLIVEVDRGQHAISIEADATRTLKLQQEGFRVLRFWNSAVLENLEGVLEVIVREIEEEAPPP